MIVIACGGRKYFRRDFVWAALDAAHAKRPFSLLLQGGATGADEDAGAWAVDRGVTMACRPADWKALGNRAGPVRNAGMLAEAIKLAKGQIRDVGVIAFPGNRGTNGMVALARNAAVTVWQPKERAPAGA